MKTKKQFRMMTRTLRQFAGMLLTSAVIVLMISCGKNNTGEVAPPPPPPPPATPVTDSVYTEVDEKPQFKGGNDSLLKYIAKNAVYPEEAKRNNIQGKVIVRFVVETDGSVSNVTILKGVDPQIDAEAIKVVKSLPRFEKPGIKSGKAVAVNFVVPINFSLK